jgi:hypothetical protein
VGCRYRLLLSLHPSIHSPDENTGCLFLKQISVM